MTAMLYIEIPVLLLMLGCLIIMSLPEVVKKKDVVRIGTIINKKYDLNYYNLDVRVETRHGPRYSRQYWCVLVYAYEKSNPHVCVGTHLIPVKFFRKSAEKKKAKIENIIKGRAEK